MLITATGQQLGAAAGLEYIVHRRTRLDRLQGSRKFGNSIIGRCWIGCLLHSKLGGLLMLITASGQQLGAAAGLEYRAAARCIGVDNRAAGTSATASSAGKLDTHHVTYHVSRDLPRTVNYYIDYKFNVRWLRQKF